MEGVWIKVEELEKLKQQRGQLLEALKIIADGPWPDDCEGPEGQCRFDAAVARAAIAKVKP